MILTGPEIRSQTEDGKKRHGKKREIRIPSKHAVRTKTVVDTTMDYIHIDPYDPDLVGPNSVDLRLGDKLLVYESAVGRFDNRATVDRNRDTQHWPRPETILGGVDMTGPVYPTGGHLDMRKENPVFELEIPEKGIMLRPGILYLGTTIECIGSNAFVPIVEGRSSIGRLGLHVHVTAGFCDLGFKGQITLEIHVIHPIRVYAGVPICQAYFLKPEGEIELYKGRYRDQKGPVPSRIHLAQDGSAK